MPRPAVAWSAAVALATAVALPAVWWEPLHVDEWVTLSVAPRSAGAIVEEIFERKGGSPVHFFLEHVLLQWPGGIEGLRLPSLVAFAIALPAAGLLAREFAGRRESLLLPVVLAVSPLAVELATFGRMYGLLLALYLWAVLAALHAARKGTRALVLAAAALGALVYVHPLAPLYGGPALAGVVFLARVRPLAAVWAGAAFFAAGVPYWAYALWRLRDRYYVGYAGSERLEATSGRSVGEESLLALSAGHWAGAAAFAVLAAAGAVALWRRGRRRETVVLAAWVVIPVVFFALVPAGNVEAGGTRFYPRYLLPALPGFLLFVTTGCLAAPRAAAAVLAALVLGLQANDDRTRLERLRRLHLPAAVAAVRSLGDDAVLLPADGRAIVGRPAYLLDEFLELEAPAARRAGAGVRVRLVAGPPRFLDGVERRLGAAARAERVSERLLLIRRPGRTPAGLIGPEAFGFSLSWTPPTHPPPAAARRSSPPRAPPP